VGGEAGKGRAESGIIEVGSGHFAIEKGQRGRKQKGVGTGIKGYGMREVWFVSPAPSLQHPKVEFYSLVINWFIAGVRLGT